MKSSDVIMATAVLVLVGLSVDAVLMVAFAPLSSSTMSDLLAYIISFLVISLIVGYAFALKIQEESRIKAVAGIVVLFALAVLFFIVMWIANPTASLGSRTLLVACSIRAGGQIMIGQLIRHFLVR